MAILHQKGQGQLESSGVILQGPGYSRIYHSLILFVWSLAVKSA